jgi:hypothetical protein
VRSETRESQKFFGMSDPRDLHRKCCHDLDRLKTLDAQRPLDPSMVAYTLFDLAVGLNHLFDWVLSDPNLADETKARCVQRFSPYRREGEARTRFTRYRMYLTPFPPKTNPKQALVKDVADGVKHFVGMPKTATQKNSVYLGAGGEDAVCGGQFAQCRQNNLLVLYTYWVKDNDGKSVEFSTLCDSLVSEWGEFIDEACLGRKELENRALL